MNSHTPNRHRAGGFTRLRLESLEGRDVPSTLGELDPTFGVGGKVTMALDGHGTWLDGNYAAVVSSLGRTLAVYDSAADDLRVTRVNADGSIDTTFGTGGTVDLKSLGFTAAGGVAVDASGNVLLLGHAGGLAVVRLTPTGALDPTFGTGGVAQCPDAEAAGSPRGPGAITLDAAGNIVVARGSDAGFGIARLTPDGQPDPTFHGGAVQSLGKYVLVTAVTVDASGRILVANDNYATLPVARLNSDGSPDTTFSFGLSSPPMSMILSGLATDAAGDVFLGGYIHSRGVVVKLTPDGSPDPTFGTGGVFSSPVGNTPFLNFYSPLTVLPDGRVIAAYTVDTPSPMNPVEADFAVVGLTPAGALDPDFNPDGPTPGTNVFGFGTGVMPQVAGVSLTPDGDIIVAGFDNGGGIRNGNLDLARLIGRSDGSLSDNPDGGEWTDPFASQLVRNVRTTFGDVDGDGTADRIFVTGPGQPTRFAVVSGKDHQTLLVQPTPAFPGSENFTGGAWVAAGDFDHDGRAEIVLAADEGGGPRVAVWDLGRDGLIPRASFFGITGDPNFRGGTRIAAGDVNHDGTADLIVAAGSGGGPRVALFDGTSVLSGSPVKLVPDFFAFPGADVASLRNGAFVAAGDVNGDGFADLIFGAGPGGGPRVEVFSGHTLTANDPAGSAQANPIANFFVSGLDPNSRTGAAVAITTAAGDGVADVAAGAPGPRALPTEPLPTDPIVQPLRIPVYAGSALASGAPPTPALFIDPATDPVLAGVFLG
jgi:uncharacterized delta-60 repeat protein